MQFHELKLRRGPLVDAKKILTRDARQIGVHVSVFTFEPKQAFLACVVNGGPTQEES